MSILSKSIFYILLANIRVHYCCTIIRIGNNKITNDNQDEIFTTRSAATHDIIRERRFLLPMLSMQLSANAQIEFELFDGKIVNGEVSSPNYRGQDVFTWIGNLKAIISVKDASYTSTEIEGTFGLSCVRGSCSGQLHIHAPSEEEYHITHSGSVEASTGTEIYILAQVYLPKERKSATKALLDSNMTAHHIFQNIGRKLSDFSSDITTTDLIIDVLVMYTPEALAAITVGYVNFNEYSLFIYLFISTQMIMFSFNPHAVETYSTGNPGPARKLTPMESSAR